MAKALKSIYDQVLAIAASKRAENEGNTMWEDFKASRLDPALKRIQREIDRASSQGQRPSWA